MPWVGRFCGRCLWKRRIGATRRGGLVLFWSTGKKVVVVGKRSGNGLFINDWFSRQYRLILQKRQDNYLFLILFRIRNGPEICL
jgi:hypothetical protein